MSIKALYYCRPRILILSVLLSVFSFFNLVHWLQYASGDNISSLIFCFGLVLSLSGTSVLFILHSVPFSNERAKQFAAIFILFGGILWFIASCFELSVDNNYCDLYLCFCELHVFGYILLPFGTSIMLSMDEFFDNLFYHNQRLRITTYSLLLLLSAIIFIPYYILLNDYDPFEISIMDINVYIQTAYITVWSGIALSSLLMIICIGICTIHKRGNKQNILSWISSGLLMSGSAILVIPYVAQNQTNHISQFNIDDPIICYNLLVCAISWIVAIDAIVNNNIFQKYQKISNNMKY